MKTLEERVEVAVSCYAKTFDKRLAYKKAGITSEEAQELDRNEGFQSRMDYYLILEKERVLEELQNLTRSPDERIKIKAVLEYGRLVYPEFFKEPEEEPKPPIEPEEVEEFFKNESNNQ